MFFYKSDKSLRSSLENIWYYYKFYIMIGFLACVMVVVLVHSCIQKQSYDLSVLYLSTGATSDFDQTRQLADKIELFATDINGDGEVNVEIIAISYGVTTAEHQSASSRRGAIIASGRALFYVFDELNYNELNSAGFLEDISLFGESEFLEQTRFRAFDSGMLDDISDFMEIGEQYYIGMRVFDEKKAQSDSHFKEQYNSAKLAITNIINNYK